MAWSNYLYTLGSFTGASTNTTNFENTSQTRVDGDNTLFSGGTNFNNLENGDTTLYSENGYELIVSKGGTNKVDFRYNNESVFNYSGGFLNDMTGSDRGAYTTIAIGIDTDNQKARVIVCSERHYTPHRNFISRYEPADETQQSNLYQWLNSNIPPQYVWQSVPAISGKNGILSLPTLVDTDGEPISGQSASVFSSLPEGSNVRALINGAL